LRSCFGSWDGGVYALDAGQGELRWRYETDGWVTASPVINDGVIYVGSHDGFLYALEAEDGDLVCVVDSQGRYLATGYLNRRSQIVVRNLTWHAHECLDAGFWRQRLERAIAGRSWLTSGGNPVAETNAYRLVHAESDGLPGLVVDRYADWLVVQCLTLGMARRRAASPFRRLPCRAGRGRSRHRTGDLRAGRAGYAPERGWRVWLARTRRESG